MDSAITIVRTFKSEQILQNRSTRGGQPNGEFEGGDKDAASKAGPMPTVGAEGSRCRQETGRGDLGLTGCPMRSSIDLARRLTGGWDATHLDEPPFQSG